MMVPGIVLHHRWWNGSGGASSSSVLQRSPPVSAPRDNGMKNESVQSLPDELTTREAGGLFGRPGPEQRAENRARMVEETGDALVKYGMVAGTLLFSPNPIMKVWAIIQAFGIETQSDY